MRQKTHGVENLRKLMLAFDELVKLVDAAKEDDGKLSWSDLLSKKVLTHGMNSADYLVEAVENYKALKDELWDLDVQEVHDLLGELIDVANDTLEDPV